MKLKCDCCGFEREFSDGALGEEEAFIAGWDAPPHFTGFIVCDLCPAMCIVLRLSHAKAHALWKKEGRPAEFSLNKCAPDKDFTTRH